MDFKKKLFAFDIDGTLFDHKYKEVPQKALDTINQLKALGHIVGIATGRNLTQTEKVLDLDMFDFVILCNGGYLQMDNKRIKSVSFPTSAVNHLVDLFEENNLEYGCTNYHHLCAPNPYSEKCQRVVKRYSIITPIQTPNIRHEEIFQLTVYEDLDTLKLLPGIKDKYVIHELFEFGYDIVLPKIDKALMLEEVADIFNIEMEDTIAFGDADNDVNFLQAAGLGIAVGNATKRAKEFADYITTESYNDGIYNAIKHFKYI